MKEYKPILRTSYSSEALCSATTLGDSVIGILFEKKGSEIKKAINSRLALVNEKIKYYEATAGKIDIFIEKKRDILRDIDHYFTDRSDEKTSLIKPYQREIDAILKRCCDKVYEYDKDTYKGVANKALNFENGFEDFKDTFKELDDLLQEEQETIESVRGIGYGDYVRGVTGCQGATGYFGIAGVPGIPGTAGIKVDPGKYTYTAVEEEEDRAMSRLKTLRQLVQKYIDKLNVLERAIQALKEESRRLTLIRNNLDDNRSYKLDLGKLSAFGFEDVENTEEVVASKSKGVDCFPKNQQCPIPRKMEGSTGLGNYTVKCPGIDNCTFIC